MYIGATIQIVGGLIIGTDPDGLNSTRKMYIMSGFALFGYGMGMFSVPILPEIIEAVEEDAKMKSIELDDQKLQIIKMLAEEQ